MDSGEVRRLIDVARTSLTRSLDRLRDEHGSAERDPEPEWADRGQALEGREELRTMRAELEAELRDIESAAARLADGSYGRCTECGADIPEERLRALPWARTCVAHATAGRVQRTAF